MLSRRSLLGGATTVLAMRGPAIALSDRGGFALEDFLGRIWRNERVEFPLSTADLKKAQVDWALVGPDDKPTLYQVMFDGGAPRLHFLADLDPFEKRQYRFVEWSSRGRPSNDLAIEGADDEWRLANNKVGISVRRHLKDGQGPLAKIRLASGAWIGDSRLAASRKLTSYRCEMLARGPVFADLLCEATYDDARRWRLRLRLQADEPVVLIDETFSLMDDSAFTLMLSPDFAPDRLFYRLGSGTDAANRVGKLAYWAIPPDDHGEVFVFEPWLHWQVRERQGTWFGLYGDSRPDLLAIAARSPAIWVDSKQPEQRRSARVPLTKDGAALHWRLPLADGARQWMIVALDKDAALAPLRERKDYVAPLPQQYQIKHADFPLDVIKNQVADWNDEDQHPNLIVTPGDVAELRSRARLDPVLLARYRKARAVMNSSLDDLVYYYLASEDEELGRGLTATAVGWLQDAVNSYLHQDHLVTIGFAPHHQTAILPTINVLDVVWPLLSPPMRRRVNAQLAFLGYTLNRADYWSPERGFAANPNMTSAVAAFRAVIGLMIASHPMAPRWKEAGIGELRRELAEWADDSGGWLEAPGYAVLSYDYMLAVFQMVANGGEPGPLADEKMEKVIAWLAKISTPPDPRLDGQRHFPAIGNTYIREPSGEFGIVARLWKDRNLDFAATMQWMFQQQGSRQEAGIGGFWPALAGYRRYLLDTPLAAKAPAYSSELFPRSGAILRSGFPTARETRLYMIAGTNHAHYDQDSGSITIWGKGRAVADDFGYQGNMPADDHSMLVSRRTPGAEIMQIADFAASESFDYLHGIKSTWRRQIVFVKDADPLAANYFVIADSLTPADSGRWRLWLTANAVATSGNGALVSGIDDVDTDIFILRPARVALSTELRTRVGPGITAGKYGLASCTQIGLTVDFDDSPGLAFVVYPRLKSEPPATFTALADGRAVKVQGRSGIDYVFMSDRLISYRDDDVSFAGTVGAIQMRGGEPRMMLAATGTINAGRKKLNKL
jgi:hypothetical protein